MDDALRVVRTSLFFEPFAAEDLEWLRTRAAVVVVEADEVIAREGDPADRFCVLVEGTVELSTAPAADDLPVSHRAPLRTVVAPGQPLGWAALVHPWVHLVTATTRTSVTVLAWDREQLEARARERPGFGVVFQRQILGVLGARLRAARLRLVARRYDAEVVAIRALIEQYGEDLSLGSPVHKLPHYLQSRLTLPDAFAVLQELHTSSSPIEHTLADVIAEILEDVRQELRVYSRLQGIYELVAGAPDDVDHEALRAESCRRFVDLFDETRHVIRGLENLPEGGGHIVVMNHLVNHIDNSLPNRFTLTLDTHFVSAMLLYRHYGQAPVRVIRASGRREYGHRRYYDRLGYIYVSSRTPGEESARAIDPAEFNHQVADTLAAGHNLVICPEGTSVPTAQSPVRFRPGIFGLAASLDPEPLIVPVVVANFDRQVTKTTTVAVVHPPFRVSERVSDPMNREQLLNFLNDDLLPQYSEWVKDAVAFAAGSGG
ncbi:MAG TPA: cyclic nucleotide-binding domain-containing protein [Propionibacteriaceae bacterium]